MNAFKLGLLGIIALVPAGLYAAGSEPQMLWATSGLLFAEADLKHLPEESTWLGVYNEGEKYVVDEVKVIVKPAPGAITNPNQGSTMGKRVFLSPDKPPLFLLKDVPGVRRGPVKAAVIGRSTGDKVKEVPIDFKGEKYKFQFEIRTYVTGHPQGGVTENFERSDESVGIKHRYALVHENTEQELSSNLPTSDQDRFSGGEHYYVTGSKEKIEAGLKEKVGKSIIFTGDLDRDGALDIVLDQAFRGVHNVLYLSSFAGKGGLVGQAMSCGYFDPNDPGC